VLARRSRLPLHRGCGTRTRPLVHDRRRRSALPAQLLQGRDDRRVEGVTPRPRGTLVDPQADICSHATPISGGVSRPWVQPLKMQSSVSSRPVGRSRATRAR
jgi:hypothetical protein